MQRRLMVLLAAAAAAADQASLSAVVPGVLINGVDDFNSTAFAEAIEVALVTAGAPENASLAVTAWATACVVENTNDDGDANTTTCSIRSTVVVDSWAKAEVLTLLQTGISLTDEAGATYSGYAYGAVQMSFALSLDDINATDFKAAVLTSVLASGSVSESSILGIGIWAGSVIVQIDYTDTSGTGFELISLIYNGLDVTYSDASYTAAYAAGNSTAPTSVPTAAPTAPTFAPTRAPTMPARDVPFQSNQGAPLTHVKLMVAAIAAAVVSFSAFMVLIVTELRLYMSGEYRTKLNSMAMRYVDYDGACPTAPLIRDESQRVGVVGYGTDNGNVTSYPTTASARAQIGPSPSVQTTAFATASDLPDNETKVDPLNDYIAIDDVQLSSPTGQSHQAHTML